MRGLRIVVLPFIFALTVCAAETDARLQVVQKLVEAFNAQDVDAMAAQVTEDIEWLSIQGAAISVEARGKMANAIAYKPDPAAFAMLHPRSFMILPPNLNVRHRENHLAPPGTDPSATALEQDAYSPTQMTCFWPRM